MKSYEIVEVEWEDAQSSLDRWDVEELKALKPSITFSVGYLLDENKDRVLLGFMVFGKDLIKHSQYIPRGMVRNMRFLTLDKRPNSNIIDALR